MKMGLAFVRYFSYFLEVVNVPGLCRAGNTDYCENFYPIDTLLIVLEDIITCFFQFIDVDLILGINRDFYNIVISNAKGARDLLNGVMPPFRNDYNRP